MCANRNTVTIDRITGHRISKNGRTEVLIKFSKPLVFSAWLPLKNRKYESPWLKYCARLFRTVDNANMKVQAREIYQILSKRLCPDELTVLSKKYRTNRGLQLPPSNKDEIMNYISRLLKNGSRLRLYETRNLRQRILLEKTIKARRKQVDENRIHEWIINTLSSNSQYISFANNVDLERFPQSLTWIENYKLSRNVNIAEDEQVAVACNCSTKACELAQCQHGDDGCAYNTEGRIVLEQGKPVYECNPFCGCDESCANRVSQKGAIVPLEIFRSHTETGFAVRSVQKIPKGMFIAVYVGELMLWMEAETRFSSEYLFDLDFHYQEEKAHCTSTADAALYGNISRFINHSCEPNLSVFPIYTKIIYPEYYSIGFFTSKEIEAGEELCINYIKLITQKGYICRCSQQKCIGAHMVMTEKKKSSLNRWNL